MSYSFTVTAATKGEAKAAVSFRLDEVASGQKVHERDRAAAQAAVNAMLDVLVDPTNNEKVTVSVGGSLGWRAQDEYTSAGVNVSVAITK